MYSQSIFTGIKICSSNTENTDSNLYNQQFLSVKDNTIILRDKQTYKKLNYDCCLSHNSTQQDIYDNFCLTMAEDFLQGYDCTLILCGKNQNKIPTVQNLNKNNFLDIMLGKQAQQSKGIIPRLIDQLDNYVKHKLQRKFLFKISFIQINEQQIIDLLAIKKCKLDIKQSKTNKNQFYVHNLDIKMIKKLDQIQSFYVLGDRKREYSYSKQYRKRENSNSFFTIYLETFQENKSVYKSSKFTFCQLSPSNFDQLHQRQIAKNMEGSHSSKFFSSKQVFKENKNGTHLDLSKFAFRNVISTLLYGQDRTYVPFNDSKITKLLRQALGGNSKTSILGLINNDDQKNINLSFRILKTLQMASQLSNYPTNIKQYSNQKINSSNDNIMKIIQQIHRLSVQLDKQKLDLQILLGNQNFVSNEVQRLKNQNNPSLIVQNQFCSQQNLQNCALQQKTKQQWEFKQKIKQTNKLLNEKISFVLNFDHEQYSNKQKESELNINYQNIISKRKQILARTKNIKMHRLNMISGQNQITQNNRQSKRQVFALQMEFQKQRQYFTNTIRNLQLSLSFYKKIAQNILKPEELQIIQASSHYDETKRQYQVPKFLVQDRKLKAGNILKPMVSQRKFIVSPRSSSFNSRNSINNRSNSLSNKKIVTFSNRNIKNIENILSRKPQKSQDYISQYQSTENKNNIQQNKSLKKNKFTGFSIARSKSKGNSSNNITSSGSRELLSQSQRQKNKIQNSIKMVRSEYEIQKVDKIDMNRVIKYNNQRKQRISKEKQAHYSPNLMKRQKLNIEKEEDTKNKRKNTYHEQYYQRLNSPYGLTNRLGVKSPDKTKNNFQTQRWA